MDALKKAKHDLDAEADRAIQLVLNSALLVLRRKHGYGRIRLGRFLDEMQVTFNECGSTNEKSMIQMLEEQTGIEIRTSDGSSWRNFPYLNNDMWDKKPPKNRAQQIYIYQRMKKWVYPSFMAHMLLAMNRTGGWAVDRLSQFYLDMNEVKEEYSFDNKKLTMAAVEETGITFDIVGGEMWVHPYRDICKGCDYSEPKCRACEKRKEYDRRLMKGRWQEN